MRRRREERKQERATFGRKGTATRYQMRFGYFVRAATEEAFTVKFDDLAIWLIEE